MSRKKLHKSEKKLSDLGNRINILLKTKHLNQSGLAKILELSNSYITEIMQGRTKKGGLKFWDSIKREFSDWEKFLRGYVKEPARTPHEKPSARPGSTNGTKGIEICGYKFRNRKTAVKYVKYMWDIEQLDGALFNHELKCLKSALDAADIMVEKTNLKLVK